MIGRGGGEDQACAPDELALAPMPSFDWSRPLESLLGPLQTYNSYAIVDRERGDAELHCYGS